MPDEHGFVLERLLKRLCEQATLFGCGCGIVMLATAPDEAHLHGKDAWVLVPGLAELRHERLSLF